MNIGEVARATGLPAKTIRYYEEIGLVRPERRDNGYRRYGEPEPHRLAFVQWARGLGFAIDDASRALYLETVAANLGLPDISAQEFLMAWDPVARSERWRVPLGASGYQAGGVLTSAGNLVYPGSRFGRAVFLPRRYARFAPSHRRGNRNHGRTDQLCHRRREVRRRAGRGRAFASTLAARNRYENYARMLAFKLGGGPTPLPPVRQQTKTPEPPADFVRIGRTSCVFGTADIYVCEGPGWFGGTYGGGAQAFFAILWDWRARGDFEGMDRR
ncbi:MAG: MerR family DNA-binding transcriptional regulator [Deltaproteobacteria bacterium]|jgi:DNA-binding transcriptional MerR regulator|nr:MerR family DNA-binding transcriptional regulator [Deltaproteobacteria bacterium]